MIYSQKSVKNMFVGVYGYRQTLFLDAENGAWERERLAVDQLPYAPMRATFPAGTVSGAPKIRAMQIISELEGTTRGPYAGCVGYFSFNGNLDTCITIRTAMLKDGKAYVQAGGGWVNDSTPEGEYQETVNKAKAMLKAVALAESFAGVK